MMSSMLLYVLVLLSSILVEGGWPQRIHEAVASYKRSHDDADNKTTAAHPGFPHDIYNQIPDDILEDVLCVVFNAQSKVRLQAVDRIYERYGSSKSIDITSVVQRLMQSDFPGALVRLRKQAFRDLSQAGKAKFCKLLRHMPDTYNTCGFHNFTKILADQCVTTSEFDHTPLSAASVTAASTTAHVAAPSSTTTPTLNCRDIRYIESFARTTRIVGGFAAQQGVFDSFASINIGFRINPICGATIIDSCTVLTAAHCVHQIAFFPLSVNVGDHTRIHSTSQLRVRRVYVHKLYNSKTAANDIAILKIDPIDFNAMPNTAPACLATTDFTLKGIECTSVGVGSTHYGGKSPFNFRLQQVTTPTWDGVSCNRNSWFRVPVSDPPNQICSGARGKNTCQGDSGGPVFCHQEGRQVLTGVVSYGVGCGLARFPGVNIKVSSYVDWIAARSGC